jgi:RNA-directed DNA polymerase
MKTVGPPYSGKLNVRWDGKGMVIDQDRASEALHMGKPAATDMPSLPSLNHSFTLDCNIHVSSRRAGQRVLESITVFVQRRLKLKVNRDKSGVARPWESKLLGYSMTHHIKPRLKVARQSVKRIREKLKERFRRGKGRRLDRFTEQELNPILRGWGNYFELAEVEGTFEELDQWVRRKLRQMLWRQWKRNYTRAARLIRRGLDKERAVKSAGNGRGSWWNSGASHMNQAFPKKFFDHLGLVSLLNQRRGVLKTT